LIVRCKTKFPTLANILVYRVKLIDLIGPKSDIYNHIKKTRVPHAFTIQQTN